MFFTEPIVAKLRAIIRAVPPSRDGEPPTPDDVLTYVEGLHAHLWKRVRSGHIDEIIALKYVETRLDLLRDPSNHSSIDRMITLGRAAESASQLRTPHPVM